MKLITVTVKAAFPDTAGVTLDGVREVLFRGVSDGLEADVAFTEHGRELTITVPDPDYDDDARDDNEETSADRWQARAREELDRFGALPAIQALLVNERGQWRANVSGADLVQQLTDILTAHGVGGDGDEAEAAHTPCAGDEDGITRCAECWETWPCPSAPPEATTAPPAPGDDYPHRYTVFATCTGTIKEVWRVRSKHALTRESLLDHDTTRGDALVEFVSQETDDEEDRTVTDIEVEAGELAHDCKVCGGSGRKEPDPHSIAGGSLIEPCPVCSGSGVQP